MIEIVRTDHDLCTGCNRCVRECPIEMANTTYQCENGSIKVKVDYTKCVVCGRCITACRHNARSYEDDTGRFFRDLSEGAQISLIAAPSVRTNIPDWKRLFTYLKSLGVKKIYDVSLGADICIWAHVRYIQKYGRRPLITQPCPAIVTYCEVYQHAQLGNLSPIHSPMACIAIYMREYEGISDGIAALSPCIAKADEFDEVRSPKYNVTFSKLLEFLKSNKIELPEEETGFDHHDCALGSLFPMPGGLSENLEFMLGKKLNISRFEGTEVYQKLDSYASTAEGYLPDIFDVLNCSGGCNFGSGCFHDRTMFEVDSIMRKSRQEAILNRDRSYFESLYDRYDAGFDLSLFLREYVPAQTHLPQVTEDDIQTAFRQLDKNNYEKQNINCGACGSDTCRAMARRIALGANIPMNCIVKVMDDAREEHAQKVIAERENKAKSSFLATMSHEIRTPMNAILGITEIQMRDESLPPDVVDALRRIYASGDLLLGIINDILDLSKIEAGKLEILPDKFEVASLINDTVQLNLLRIGNKPIEFVLKVDPATPATAFGDALRIKQILSNLLSNAFKYTLEGKVELSVFTEPMIGNEIGHEIKGQWIVFKVRDTGQGMSEDQVSKLFDDYSRFNIEANRLTEGTGLGMGITRNLVAMMKGEISVRSRLGEGSEFVVKIPQGNIDTSELGRELAENLGRFRSHGGDHSAKTQIVHEPMPYGSVLIVDDAETNLFVAKGFLLPYRLSIDTADSGFAAIEKIENGNMYDIIFMDHMMPRMDGVETTRLLREMDYTDPIVALTANAIVGQEDIFLKNGFDAFISKPIDVRHLDDILNKFIRDKQPAKVVEEARLFYGADDKDKAGATSPSQVNPVIAEAFLRDASRFVAVLESFHERHYALKNDDFKNYVIAVHGMKSALASIGETRLSAIAYQMEQAGQTRESAVISSETPVLINEIRALMDRMG